MSERKYFVYELKKAIFAICCIALIMTAITVAVILTYRYTDIFGFQTAKPESGLDVMLFMGGLLAAVVPIWMLSYKMKKRSVDLYYALPLKRGQILRVKYLLGLIAVYAPYTVAFIFGIISAVIKYPLQAISESYYFAAYFASLPAMFCLYSIVSFVFACADRMLDGFVFVIFWMFAAFAVASVVAVFFHDVSPVMFAPISPLITIADYFSSFIEAHTLSSIGYGDAHLPNMTVGYILTGLQAVAATVLLFVTEPKSKTENIGGVSNSPFGYKVMIPLLTLCLFINIDIVDSVYSILLAVIVASLAFMVTALYKHTFKIGKVQTIIFVGSIVLGVALSIAASYITAAMYA